MENMKTPKVKPLTVLFQEIIKRIEKMEKDKDKEGYTTKDYLDALTNRLDIVENAIGEIKTYLYAIDERAHETDEEIARLDADIDAIYSGTLADDEEEDKENEAYKVGGTDSEEEEEEEPEDEILKVGGTESEEEDEEKKEKPAFSYQCVIFDDKYKFDIAMDDKRNFYPDEDVWYPYCDAVVRRIAKSNDTETVVLYAFYDDSNRKDSGTTPNDAPFLLGSSSDCVMCGHFLYEAYQGKMTIVSGICSHACPVKDFVEEAKKDGCNVWFRLIGNHKKVPVAKDND